ncbi:MAG: alpha/beta hydrolase, partial [Lachnospiraceae bacterium]|nr:alpha/beta hydrolase [Lachnospiraceae bacterium]
MKTEVIILNKERNVTLTAYIQEIGGAFDFVTKRPAILILPGGGYQYCTPREADPVAFPYLKAGYQVFILRYSVNKHSTWPNPLNDYEQAMELIRANADNWGLYPDKIAVIGFSAGGHLAASAATLSKNRPNAAILGYAVVGEDVKGCNPTAPDTISAVDSNTCPCFVFATRTDGLVPIMNSVKFIEALTIHDVAYESHIYAYGPHGFSTYDSSIEHPEKKLCNRVPNWVNDSIEWLKDIFGDFGVNGMTTPTCPLHTTANHESYLSVDCTMEHILQIEAGKVIIEHIFSSILSSTSLGQFGQNKDISQNASLAGKMKLRDCLGFLKIPNDIIE